MSNMLRALAKSRIPFTFWGWSFPISSIIQCMRKSPNLRLTFSLNTLMSIMLIMAFTKVSVPSLPTCDNLSAHPVSLSFSLIRNCSWNKSESVRYWREGLSVSDFIKSRRWSTALRLMSLRSTAEKILSSPNDRELSSLNVFMRFMSWTILSADCTDCSAINLITPTKLRSTKSALMSWIMRSTSDSWRVNSPISFDTRVRIST